MLPEFKNPPVHEVALAVQFATLANFRSYHAGLLWTRVSDLYPNISEHGTLNPVFETFGAKRSSEKPVSLEVFGAPPVARHWFEASDGVQLFQFQPDRIIHNWRKLEDDVTYPRYDAVRLRLTEDIDRLSGFLNEYDLGAIKPNQCEVTYVNHVVLSDGSDPNRQFGRILRCFTREFGGPPGTEFEDGNFNLRWTITADSGEKIGRLHVQGATAIRKSDSAPLLRITLTARCVPQDDSVEAAFLMLDRGHEAVVQGFAEFTTQEMHNFWGRHE